MGSGRTDGQTDGRAGGWAMAGQGAVRWAGRWAGRWPGGDRAGVEGWPGRVVSLGEGGGENRIFRISGLGFMDRSWREMGIKTRIEWADSTVNPVMGCTGCALRRDHCYAAVLCARYAGRKGWPRSFDRPEFFPGRLERAVGWRDLTGEARADEPWLDGLPRHIFVNDLSDGFCPDADPWEWLAPSIPAMHLSPHVWLLLTKWPDRMAQFFEEWGKPIPGNFRLGVSIEEPEYSYRATILAEIPGAIRYISFEPLLASFADCPGVLDNVSGAIVGGESGPGARPMDPGWVRGLRDQCVAAGVAFFFKQWGSARPDVLEARYWLAAGWNPDGWYTHGRLLDKREWNEMPGCG